MSLFQENNYVIAIEDLIIYNRCNQPSWCTNSKAGWV